MTHLLKQLSRISLAPVIAAMFGLVMAVLVAMTPLWLLERIVSSAGLPALIPAANPPLGTTARSLCVGMAGVTTFALLWLLLAPLQTQVRKHRPQKARGSRIDPVRPPADPVRMKRPPIFAERELGAPFMSDEAIAGPPATAAPPADQRGPIASPNLFAARSPASATAEPYMATAQQTAPFMPDRPEPKANPIAIAGETDNSATDMIMSGRVETDRGEAHHGLAGEMARLESALRRRSALGLRQRPTAASNHERTRSVLRGLN